MSSEKPLLTIAIPTWKRADYLRMNLAQLNTEVANRYDMVEILVSDNCSPDDTAAVVAEAVAGGMTIRYIRNSTNIGSDHNIAQCFNEARGRYVLILGDDDLFVDGGLDKLLHRLSAHDYGVVFVRPFGYNDDFRRERPRCVSRDRELLDPGEFLVRIGALAGLISCNVINKEILSGVNADKYCGSSLVQTYLVYEAALEAGNNFIMNEYLIAYKRNNWGEYPFVEVFVGKFWGVVDSFSDRGLASSSIEKLKRNMLLGYYPFYIFKLRLKRSEKMSEDYARFNSRFGGNPWFRLTIEPQYRLPRILALVWGGLVVVVGRSLMGDACRGVNFAMSVTRRFLGGK
jgi:glycosyltransferase involved in cell wall biosynthesis